jgi:hypothetical protein
MTATRNGRPSSQVLRAVDKLRIVTGVKDEAFSFRIQFARGCHLAYRRESMAALNMEVNCGVRPKSKTKVYILNI